MVKARVKEQSIGQDTIIVKHALRHTRTLLAGETTQSNAPRSGAVTVAGGARGGRFLLSPCAVKLEGGQLLPQRWLLSHSRSAPWGLAVCAPPSPAASPSAPQQRARAAGVKAQRPQARPCCGPCQKLRSTASLGARSVQSRHHASACTPARVSCQAGGRPPCRAGRLQGEAGARSTQRTAAVGNAE